MTGHIKMAKSANICVTIIKVQKKGYKKYREKQFNCLYKYRSWTETVIKRCHIAS